MRTEHGHNGHEGFSSASRLAALKTGTDGDGLKDIPVVIQPAVLQKYATRRGISDLTHAQALFEQDFAAAKPVNMSQRDLPSTRRPSKGAKISHRRDPLNPTRVWESTTRNGQTTVTAIFNLGANKNGRVSY